MYPKAVITSLKTSALGAGLSHFHLARHESPREPHLSPFPWVSVSVSLKLCLCAVESEPGGHRAVPAQHSVRRRPTAARPCPCEDAFPATQAKVNTAFIWNVSYVDLDFWALYRARRQSVWVLYWEGSSRLELGHAGTLEKMCDLCLSAAPCHQPLIT